MRISAHKYRSFSLDFKAKNVFWEQKAAASKGMTVAEYRDKILFPHGKKRIIARYKKFVKQHPEANGTPKPPTKDNRSTLMTKNFVNRKR